MVILLLLLETINEIVINMVSANKTIAIGSIANVAVVNGSIVNTLIFLLTNRNIKCKTTFYKKYTKTWFNKMNSL